MHELFELSTNLKLTDTEVRTPPALVDAMLDRLPVSIWSDPSIRFLDPCAGTGTFIFSIIDRLMRGLETSFPIRSERVAHILANQVWAYEVCPRQFRRLRGGMHKLGIEHLLSNTYNCDTLQQEFDMKFDVIIGNPPYNPPTKVDRGGSGSGSKIWHKFIEKSFEALEEDGIVAMVTPTTWRHGDFNKNRQHKKAQELIFNHGIQDWCDAKKHFPMVGHSIGIDWWISCKNGKTNAASNPNLLLTRKNDDTINVLNEWLDSLVGDCYVQKIGSNTYLNYDHIQSETKNEKFIYPHLRTGSTTRKKLFDWYDVKTKGFDQPKVMIFRSSGPEPFYDSKGEHGCGDKAHAYLVSTDQEAKEIVDFFSSKLCDWLVHQVSEKNAIAFPTFMFKRIPKNWREIEEKHFG
jgi:site-specific DNA-methyltransferase (adenine-specific)